MPNKTKSKKQTKHAYSVSEIKEILEKLLPVWDHYNLNEGYGLLFFDKNKDIDLSRGFTVGSVNTNSPQKITSKTFTRFASISKMFTSILIMQLVTDKKIKFTDRAVKYIPELPPKAKFTIWDLLLHQAPIQRDGGTSSWSEGFWNESILQDLTKDTMIDIGEAKMKYSNFGYSLLGLIIERVTGKSYKKVVKERIYDKLGMRETWADATLEFFKYVTQKYNCQRDDVYQHIAGGTRTYHYGKIRRQVIDPKLTWCEMKSFAPAAGIVSTLADMNIFVRALIKGPKIFNISEVVWKKCIKPIIKVEGDVLGAGFEMVERDGYKLIGFSGGHNGITSFLLVDPKQQVGVVIFNQQLDIRAYTYFDIVFSILKLLQIDGRLKGKKTKIPNSKLKRFEGLYEDEWSIVNIVNIRGRLVSFTADKTPNWSNPTILQSISGNIFRQDDTGAYGNRGEKVKFEIKDGCMCMITGGEIMRRVKITS
ncbi:MAG: beta-lactamase family protein [Candidatus Vogelbacteria bacterium]|nr:beta-lactamase family protein [Candidatus Vogelbacteria bacterium]